MFEGAGLHSVDDRTGNGQNRAVAEACGDRRAAVDARHDLVFLVAAQFQSFPDDGGEVLVFAYVDESRIGYKLCCKNAVAIAILGWHETVCGEKDCAGHIGKFLLLVLPGGAEVALEVRVRLQLRIRVGGQHLAMGVNVDALVFCLLQELLKVIKVVAGDDNERAFLDRQRYGRRDGCAISICIGFVEHLHALEVYLADFHRQRQQFIHSGVGLADGLKALKEHGVNLVICITEYHRVIRVSGDAAQTYQDQGFERSDVFVNAPELQGFVRGAAVQLYIRVGGELFGFDFRGELCNGIFVKIDVGYCCKQAFDHQFNGLLGRGFAGKSYGQTYQLPGQVVLTERHFLRFAADAGLTGAGFAPGRLLALETKHTHINFPPEY